MIQDRSFGTLTPYLLILFFFSGYIELLFHVRVRFLNLFQVGLRFLIYGWLKVCL